MRGVVVAAAMMAAVSGARAADMPDLPYLRGSFTDGLTVANANWQGVHADQAPVVQLSVLKSEN